MSSSHSVLSERALMIRYEKVVSALNIQLDELRQEIVSRLSLNRGVSSAKLKSRLRLLQSTCTRCKGSLCGKQPRDKA